MVFCHGVFFFTLLSCVHSLTTTLTISLEVMDNPEVLDVTVFPNDIIQWEFTNEISSPLEFMMTSELSFTPIQLGTSLYSLNITNFVPGEYPYIINKSKFAVIRVANEHLWKTNGLLFYSLYIGDYLTWEKNHEIIVYPTKFLSIDSNITQPGLTLDRVDRYSYQFLLPGVYTFVVIVDNIVYENLVSISFVQTISWSSSLTPQHYELFTYDVLKFIWTTHETHGLETRILSKFKSSLSTQSSKSSLSTSSLSISEQTYGFSTNVTFLSNDLSANFSCPSHNAMLVTVSVNVGTLHNIFWTTDNSIFQSINICSGEMIRFYLADTTASLASPYNIRIAGPNNFHYNSRDLIHIGEMIEMRFYGEGIYYLSSIYHPDHPNRTIIINSSCMSPSHPSPPSPSPSHTTKSSSESKLIALKSFIRATEISLVMISALGFMSIFTEPGTSSTTSSSHSDNDSINLNIQINDQE